MERICTAQLKLDKNVNEGDKESLLSLFNSKERIKNMDILANAEEGQIVRVVLEGLGEVDLKLGTDIEKGQRKTIMTLFWFPEKSQKFEIKRKAEAGENVTVNIWKLN